MGSSQTCPDCGAALPQSGQCPNCLLKLGEEATLPLQPPQAKLETNVSVGPYTLVKEIGEGGMGTVWLAQQLEPIERQVALKIIKPGLASEQVLARFDAERQALALMEHPNIAKVLDAGTTQEGQPFFAMELVQGETLVKFCDRNQLPIPERLELFKQVCRAIQHAHQKGVIHRDIKPSNVLVATYDGKPVPKVIDFGVAKAVGQQLSKQTLFTGFGAVIGTLRYMSPEQAELNQIDIDTRSDIYSLGVLLYELLTGSTPLTSATIQQVAFDEVLNRIRTEEPPRPSTRLSQERERLMALSKNRNLDPRRFSKLLRGDLDWIVMKCLEKDRARRYETANGLALDVDRFLENAPVSAVAPSAAYRFRKFARRHRGLLAGAATVFLALLAGLVSTAWQWQQTERQRQITSDQYTRLRLERIEDHYAQDRSHLALANLGRLLRDQPHNRIAAERLVNTLNQRGFLVPSTNTFDAVLQSQPVSDVALDGQLRASVQQGVNIRISRIDQPPVTISEAHQRVIRSLRFDSSGDRLLSASADHTTTIWSAHNGARITTLTNTSPVHYAEFSPSGLNIVTANQVGTVLVLQATTGHLIREPIRHLDRVNTARFSPDGSWILTASDDQTVRVWPLDDTKPPSERALFDQAVDDARFSASGRHILVVLANFELQTLRKTMPIEPLPGAQFTRIEPDGLVEVRDRLAARHPGLITFAEQNSEGSILATASTDNTARVWQAHDLTPIFEPLQHNSTVNCVRFGPGGLRLVTSTAKPTKVRLWDAGTGLPLCDWISSAAPVSYVRFSENGNAIEASAGWTWPIHQATTTAPLWLARLAEAVAGTRVNDAGLHEPVPPIEFVQLQDHLANMPDLDPLISWARRFLSEEPGPATP